MSFKPGVVTDASGKLYTNGLAFATREEAQASANELMARWLLVLDTGVVESDEPVNYRFDFQSNANVRIKESEA